MNTNPENTVPNTENLITPETGAPVTIVIPAPAKELKVLTKHFFSASTRGKLNALWRAWQSGDKRKVEEFHTLVRNGFQKIEGPLTQKDVTKYITMGFIITEDVVKLPRKPRQKRMQNVPTNPETAKVITENSPEAPTAVASTPPVPEASGTDTSTQPPPVEGTQAQ